MHNRSNRDQGEKKKGAEQIFEDLMDENFPNLIYMIVYISKKINDFWV